MEVFFLFMIQITLAIGFWRIEDAINNLKNKI